MSVKSGKVARATSKGKRGYPAKPVVKFPEPLYADWIDPPGFHEALILQMDRHGDSIWHLHRAVARPDELFNRTTIRDWRLGKKAPRSALSFLVLGRLEHRYRLPEGYFHAKLPHPARATTGHVATAMIAPAERRRLAWHLPDDFDQRNATEREEILEWVRRVVVSGATDYRRFQTEAMKQRFAVRFPALTGVRRKSPAPIGDDEDGAWRDDVENELAAGTVDAPAPLADEVEALVRFKTATLTAIGYQRLGVWGEETALQKIEHLGLLFGALAASPKGDVRGYALHRDNDDLNVWVLVERWRSRADLDAHFAQPYTRALMDQFPALLGKDMELSLATEIPAQD